jgi:phosphonate transport system permease protein
MLKQRRTVLRLICFLLVVALYAKFLWDTEISVLKLQRGLPWMVDFIVRMFPPDFSVLKSALRGALQTLEIAVVGTSLAALLALPLGFLSARNVAPPGVFYGVRGVLNLFRSIDTMVYALFFVAAVGLGPFPGVMAVLVYTVMSLAKLYSEAIEGIDTSPVEAITASGATRLQILRYGVIPQIIPLFISYILYRLETNIRAAAILGFIGAGGIGFCIQTYLRMMNYRAAACVLLMKIIMVMAVDFASSQIRKALV